MKEEQLTALAGDLRDAAAVRAARESLEKARASAAQDDTKTSIQQAHDALEAVLHEVCSHMLSHGLTEATKDKEGKDKPVNKLTFTDYMKTLETTLLVGNERSDFYHYNEVRVAAKHQGGVKPHQDEAVGFVGAVTDFIRRLGLWPEASLSAAVPQPVQVPPPREEVVRKSLSARDAILKVLRRDGELAARTLYDRAEKLFKGDRRTLIAARWRLENEDDAIFYVVTHGAYRLRSGVKKELAAEEKRAERGPSGRDAVLLALAANDGEMEPEDLYDAAQKLHGGDRQAVRSGRYQLVSEGLVRLVETRGTYKLTRAGRGAVEELDE